MRITQISVTKLFGIFDHTIPLNLGDRITIIHGPNGFGKTVLLRMLNGFFNSHYPEIYTIPFTEFKVDFDEGSYLKVTKLFENKNESKKDRDITCELSKKSENLRLILKDLEDSKRFNLLVESLKKYKFSELDFKLLPSALLYNLTQNEQNQLRDILENNLTQDPKKEQFIKFIKSINIHFIEAQRLLNLLEKNENDSPIASVAMYAKELAKEIQLKLAEYGSLSQSLDRTFPARIVSKKYPSDLTEEKLRNQLSELELKRSKLINIGLLHKDENTDFQIQQQIDESTKNILAVYIQDVEDKFSVFNEIAQKIDLFTSIINQRFKYKKLIISQEQGFTFTTFDGHPLSPTDLSSGEQHELVLLYELLFKVQPNSLILIDEPEMSLHVAWQVKFLDDLQQIIKLADFDVLIATHSPDIISDRWDLTVKLEGPTE